MIIVHFMAFIYEKLILGFFVCMRACLCIGGCTCMVACTHMCAGLWRSEDNFIRIKSIWHHTHCIKYFLLDLLILFSSKCFAYMCTACVFGGQKRTLGSPEMWVPGGCEPLYVCDGNWIWVLYKKSQCS